MFATAAVSLAVKNNESVKLTLSGRSLKVQTVSGSSAVTAKCNAKQKQTRNSIMEIMWIADRGIESYAVKVNRRQAVIQRYLIGPKVIPRSGSLET